LWRPLPVAQPEQLVRLALTHLPPSYRQWVAGRSEAPTERRQMTYVMYQALARRQQVFTGLFGTDGGGSMQLERNGIPRRVSATTVTGSFFPVLGLQPQAGRLLTEADDQPGGAAGWTAVISDGLWTRLFARGPQAIGAAVSIESVPFTIVGVAPASFAGISPGADTEVWLPLSALEAMYPQLKWRTERDGWLVQPMARLRPGVTLDQARRHLASIARAVLEVAKDPSWRAQDARDFVAMRIEAQPAAAGQSGLAVSYGSALWILFAAVAAVLLIAVTNLTNLLLARATARGYEIAVRLSLGAPASRVRRQLLLESGLLAAAGAGLGLVWAEWLVSALQAAASTSTSTVHVNTSLDGRMFAFLTGLLVAVVLLAGLGPAFAAARVPLQAVMKKPRGGPRSWAFRRALIVLQTALTLTLLAGAGLMLASLRELWTANTGFQAENVAFLTPDLFNAGISRERLPRSYQNLLSEVRARPNIAAAAWVSEIPFTGALRTVLVQVPGRTDLAFDRRMIFVHLVSDGYFAAMGIPLLAGRDLPPVEAGRTDVCLISESAARRFFGSTQEAIGRRLRAGAPRPVEILGVVADAKYQNIREPAPPTLYVPYWGGGAGPGMSLAVRYRGSAEAAVASVQALFRREAGRLPYTQVRTIDGNIADSLGAERLLAWLLGGIRRLRRADLRHRALRAALLCRGATAQGPGHPHGLGREPATHPPGNPQGRVHAHRRRVGVRRLAELRVAALPGCVSVRHPGGRPAHLGRGNRQPADLGAGSHGHPRLACRARGPGGHAAGRMS